MEDRNPQVSFASVEAGPGPTPQKAVLCVDLDGTLLKTDLLFESLARLLRQRPFSVFLIPFWLLGGKAKLKRELAVRVQLDPATLPYNQEFLSHLRQRNAAPGAELWLVTGADEIHARRIADQLGLFQRVLASDGDINLTGERKMEALRQAAPERFSYAGNSRDDLAIWKHAHEAIAVSAPPRVLKALRKLHAHALVPSSEESLGGLANWRLYAAAMRIRQWPKNILVFLPLIAAHRILEPGHLWITAVAGLLFSLCASAQYLVNDLLDLEADRLHPLKRHRPFASGQLPLSTGFVLAPVLCIASVAAAMALSPALAALLAVYFTVSLSYSLYLKRFALLDAFVLSGLYILRIVAGHLVTAVAFSEWLLSFAFFLFLSLALSKRWMELRGSTSTVPASPISASPVSAGPVHGRGYLAVDAPQVNLFGVCSAFLSAVVFLQYLQSERVKQLYRSPEILWLLAPVYLFWLSRVWILNGRGLSSEDPVVQVLHDRTSYVIAGVCGLIMVAASVDIFQLAKSYW